LLVAATSTLPVALLKISQAHPLPKTVCKGVNGQCGSGDRWCAGSRGRQPRQGSCASADMGRPCSGRVSSAVSPAAGAAQHPKTDSSPAAVFVLSPFRLQWHQRHTHRGCVRELLLELVERAEGALNGGCNLAGGGAAATRARRRHPLPEVRVVQEAAAVVADEAAQLGVSDRIQRLQQAVDGKGRQVGLAALQRVDAAVELVGVGCRRGPGKRRADS
jgi:hypothetical protein